MTPDQRLRRQAKLAERFVALADTLVDDYDVVDVLDELMGTCLEVLTVEQAGLLLVDPQGQLHCVASSSEEARLLELLQIQNQEGPCLEAVRTGTAVLVDDIAATPDRWPAFTERALADGFNSVFAFPLRLREVTLGGLNLFGTEQSALDEDAQVIAKSLADVATIGILQQRSLNRTSLLAEDLQRALNTRIVLEQAKGILSERGGIALEEAFRLLRSYARSNNQKLSAVASEVVGPPHLADKVLAIRQA